MKLTTLCYIRNNDQVLMLHRTKKEADLNKDKWIGVGGKLEQHESPDDCIYREVKEETGLLLQDYQLRGIITFILPKWEDEICFLYLSDHFQGNITQCDEGDLAWIDIDKIKDLNLWEGDRAFLDELLTTNNFINLKLIYDENDYLIEVIDYQK